MGGYKHSLCWGLGAIRRGGLLGVRCALKSASFANWPTAEYHECACTIPPESYRHFFILNSVGNLMARLSRHFLIRLTSILLVLSFGSAAYAQYADVQAGTASPESAEYLEADDAFSSEARLEARQYADEQANAEAHEAAIVKRYRKVGLGMRITGGIFLAIGTTFLIFTIVGAVQTANLSNDETKDGWETGTGVVFGTVGTIFLGTVSVITLGVGSGLLAGGFGKRRRAIRRAKSEATYALSPTFHRGGAGASLTLRF